VGDRFRAPTSALLPHPTGRDTPPVGEFLGRQNFKERTLRWYDLCSELCSSVFHSCPFKELQCMAVRRTAVLARIAVPGLVERPFAERFANNSFTSSRLIRSTGISSNSDYEPTPAVCALTRRHTLEALLDPSTRVVFVPKSCFSNSLTDRRVSGLSNLRTPHALGYWNALVNCFKKL
jgi:hypothetical protein